MEKTEQVDSNLETRINLRLYWELRTWATANEYYAAEKRIRKEEEAQRAQAQQSKEAQG